MRAAEKRLTMVLLCLSGSIIYWLPFISEIYYVPVQAAFGFSKTQLGILSSTFGFVSLITYFPGGWLADRISARKLISVALLTTALAGFVFSTIPSFVICVLNIRVLGLHNSLHFLVSIDQSDTQLGNKRGARPRIWHSRRGTKCRRDDFT